MARRLGAVNDWLHRRRVVEDLPIGYLGAGAGAAAALSAATEVAGDVMAVVSTGGLPHLAGPSRRRCRRRPC
ncbi:hypothetical protein [Actinoallomurus sp. NPDC050550]|uniref:hypothetical protein n=1 Tax=Actinoallomurus sp. NPDC050550 TaxID=3154937 RepID=UPI0033EF12C8